MTSPPFPDELLTSWVQRRRCEAGHPDILPDPQWLEAAASTFKVSADILASQSIHRRFPNFPSDLLAALPQGTFVPARVRQAPPELAVNWCSQCLAEDLLAGRPAYIRHRWVMACITFCPRHRWPLTSCCGACHSSRWVWQRPPRGSVRLQCGECLRGLDRAHVGSLKAIPPVTEAWLLVMDFEQELLAAAGGKTPDQFKYNATSAHQLITQVRDICRSAMISCSHRRPLSMLVNQFRWPAPPDTGKQDHFEPCADAFPLHTAGITRRRSLLALCAALSDSRAFVGEHLFPGQMEHLLRNFAERCAVIYGDSGLASRRWSATLHAKVTSVAEREQRVANQGATASRIARLENAIAAGRAFAGTAASSTSATSRAVPVRPYCSRSPAVL